IVPAMVVANPVPVQFWKREMLWRDSNHYGQGVFSAPDQVVLDPKIGQHEMSNTFALAELSKDKNAKAFLFWSRMPVLREELREESKVRILSDQRFGNPLVQDRFRVVVPTEQDAK
ncbi:MAG TPA: hypothetical protein PKK17_12985, partial [Sphingorhabdus lacus]|nr:hypothetical protein [Sphingorhabdus lacus]